MLIEKNNKLYIRACRREQQFWESDFFNTQSSWEKSEYIQEYINLKRTGNKNLTYLTHLKTLWNFKKWLSIGWWFWEEELALVSNWVVQNMTFIDFSDGSNNILELNAKELWITDRVSAINGDLNFISLTENKYDFIICRNVLHHIINLEECLFELNKSLTSNWIIVIDEYIWPNRFQWTNERLDFIKDFQNKLLNKYDISTFTFKRTNSKTLVNNCPFESIRSEELYNLINYYFWDKAIYEKLYWELFEDHSFYYLWEDKKFYDELVEFEKLANKEYNIKPPRLYGIYKKDKKPLIKTVLWTKQEVKKRIWILPISELWLMKFANTIKSKYPRSYKTLKNIYFGMRK